MKLQYGIFKQLNNPKETYQLEGKTVEIHSMNDTKFLSRFAGKGQFAVWTSDSKSYKLLIEDGYYQVMKDLYSKRVNQVWITFYEKADKVRFGLMYKMVFPMIAVSMVLAILFSTLEALRDYQNFALIGILGVVLVTNMLQTTIMRKKVEEARTTAVKDIQMIIGENKFNDLLEKQGKYYEDYFKFEEKVEPAVEVSEEPKAEEENPKSK
ncbi:hypothetical protein N7603_00045 [Acholeplasma vituli]|uniref:Uncharacterized protein n=1 Tax=Paracholeplasma vituli TaxID=69473 RepID=A0ABT2PSW2_9MOLU|nr:hypothetical protein [Paracholeplasma vituli]MCU0104051.1 hypothetical protein [Paracholeplasma vituli]